MEDALAGGLVERPGGIGQTGLRRSGIAGPEGHTHGPDEVAYASLDGLIALAPRQTLPMPLQGRWVICHEGG
jgi:hypothetical protein